MLRLRGCSTHMSGRGSTSYTLPFSATYILPSPTVAYSSSAVYSLPGAAPVSHPSSPAIDGP